MSGVHPYYIITGPPSSGKSSIISELIKKGHVCHNEVAREIIQENKINGIDHFPWKNMSLFSDQVYNRILDNIKKLKGELCFFDRSIVDLIAYLELNSIFDNQKYIDSISRVGYNKNVFYLPYWDKIYTHDQERKESKEEAINIGNQLRKVYNDLGFNLIDVPHGNIQQRVDFILNRVL